jgi:hypothetical protein
MALRKIGPKPLHLSLAQPIQIAHQARVGSGKVNPAGLATSSRLMGPEPKPDGGILAAKARFVPVPHSRPQRRAEIHIAPPSTYELADVFRYQLCAHLPQIDLGPHARLSLSSGSGYGS